MDRGTLQATVHGVTESWTRLGDEHIHTHTHSHHYRIPGGLCCVKDLKCIVATNSSKSDGLTELGETETRYTMG